MSKKSFRLILTILFILFLFSGCSVNEDTFSMVQVTGDVETEFGLDNYNENFTWTEIKKEDKIYKGVLLKDLVDNSKPLQEEYFVMLQGKDGLMSKINGNELEECYIVNNSEYGWCSVNLNHPVNSNIKNLNNIIVINKNKDLDDYVNIINTNNNIFSISAGNFWLYNYNIYNYVDGETSINEKNNVTVYKQKRVIPVKDIIEDNINRVLIMTKEGGYYYSKQPGFIQLAGNIINFMLPNERTVYYDIVGIMANPPETTVMDTYYDAEYYLQKDEKVMILFVDGFGYHQYKYAIENGYAPFIKSLPQAKIANTVYRPVTNAGYTAMVTGKPPIENGIKDRSGRQPKVKTIFERAQELGKTANVIESYSCAIVTGVTPVLSLDNDEDGYTDKEVFINADKKLNEENDLILVHFHGVDDAGHNYGDLDERTMNKIKEVDSYVEKLSKKWDGKIILTADHGMHKKGQEGTHGYFRYEDLIIPYITYN